ncbi:MAG: hypothetical protein JO020_15195 [Chloroflexi bacterium]|nr:hypothetical protein [Chloroflexota bacterium]
MPKSSRNTGELWKTEPEAHDYPAALDYLSLILPPVTAQRLVQALRTADTVHRKAKDLLRASELPLLPAINPHVKSDLRKIKRGQRLAPVLLVRGDAQRSGRRLTIADGYHRICASYMTDEDADIPCRIVDLPSRSSGTSG